LPSDHNISWSPDSKKLYFTQADLRDGFNLYQDIYSYDLEDDSVERITKNLRAKDIDVSPDGKYIVFVKVETLRQNIAILSLKQGGAVETITDLKDCTLSGLRWSPDNSFIVFSKRDNTGQTSIELLNVKTKTVETLFIDKHNNIYPTWSPDGKYIIFTSDGTGVYNLFAYSLADNRVFQVTHVLGGAFHADISVSGDKIFFSGYHSKGFYIAEMPYDPSRWSTNYSPAIRPVWGNEDKGQVKESLERKDPVKVSEKRDYSALPTLLPGFWLPTLTSDHDGAVFGAFTAGQDVLGYHTYILQAGYGVSNQAYYDASYIYDRWYPSFYLRGYSLPGFYSEFFNNEYDYYERQSGMMAGIKIPLNYLESKFSLIAGYHLEKVEHLTQIRGRKVNGLGVYEGRRDNVFAGIEYRNALKYPYSISREEGRDITLLYKDYSKSLGSGLTQREYSANYKEFIGLGKHHVIYLNLKGATSDGDLIAQQAYQLGGIPSATNDYYLRGFSSKFKTGRSVVTGTLEYRFPAYYIFKGWSTKPFFMDRLHCAVFTDAGNVWGYKKRFHWEDFDVGIGTEVRLDMVLGYKISITPAIGIAHGITGDGETQVYFNIYVDL
jgi:dipeptidyl aminopeptidase/acylaminoacyl peptidase